MEQTPKKIRLTEYRPPAFLVDTVQLYFDLDPERTLVTAELACRRNPLAPATGDCVLDGRDLQLVALLLDHEPLEMDRFTVDSERLVIHHPPDRFLLSVTTELQPAANTTLEGLYCSGDLLCTQCEAEGFRRITYYPDRPDVLARFTTVLAADRDRYPVLLAGGNPVEHCGCDNGRHYAVWYDPFPKPAYLFALVAGDLARLEDRHRTTSGRDITLRLWTHPRHLDQCGHAMASLKKAMAWDEAAFGLECDLDLYQVVAVDDFNMGAMENKGLNIFNAKYVLCRSETATDDDFEAVEAVVAHEYFHNWTGNRVTCRDWFQLALKEGLTVFRDQEFTAEATAGPAKRIQDFRYLRTFQFREDASPLAHPVRPKEYQEINNFYTVTVYEKGAEIVRMLQTLLGKATFRRGVQRYLQQHDGTAATIEDFLAALAATANRDLSRFLRWYDQAGTPQLTVTATHDPERATLTLHLRQHIPPTPGQPVKQPVPIPCAVGLLASDGSPIPVHLAGEGEEAAAATRVLLLEDQEATFTCVGVEDRPVVSLLRGFSAPVELRYPRPPEEEAFLWQHDPDPCSRWDAAQRLAVTVLRELVQCQAPAAAGPDIPGLEEFLATWGAILATPLDDETLWSQLLALPSQDYLAEQFAVIPVEPLHQAHRGLRRTLGERYREVLAARYQERWTRIPAAYSPANAGRRRMQNLCLAYLAATGGEEELERCHHQYCRAATMTNRLAALRELAHTANPWREHVLADFEQRWRHEPLVLDKWLAVQATAPLPETLDRVKELMAHPAFSIRNPNRVRALIGSFAQHNPLGFHRPDGQGYRFVSEQILTLDRLNPQTAARLATAFSRWRRYEPARRSLMAAELQRLGAEATSRDLAEMVERMTGEG